MRHSRKYDFRTAYIDILINLLTGTVVIMMMTSLLINVIQKNTEGIKKNADYVISMEWPVGVDCDIDLWVKDPQENTVSFKLKEGGLMYYERDDMGHRMSVHRIEDKDVIIDPDNKEFITLRGTMPGEYIVNIHAYSCIDKTNETGKGLPKGSPINIPVTVELVKINPNLEVLKHIEMKLEKVWEEKTVVRFVMDEDKNVLRYFYDFVSVGATVEAK